MEYLRDCATGDMFGVNAEDSALQSAYRALDAGINLSSSTSPLPESGAVLAAIGSDRGRHWISGLRQNN